MSIFGEELTKSGLISNKNKRGKNTTTNVALYKIKENEYIADTPGFSTFDISEIESDKLAEYFKEFREPAKDCEYTQGVDTLKKKIVESERQCKKEKYQKVDIKIS